MKRALAIGHFILALAFCLLPYLIGMSAPTLARPNAQNIALVFLAITAACSIYALFRPSKISLLVTCNIGCLAVLFSSISWWGIPFIDAIFMATGCASIVIITIITAYLARLAVLAGCKHKDKNGA